MKKFIFSLGLMLSMVAATWAQIPCAAPAQVAGIALQDNTSAYVIWTPTTAATYSLQYRLGSDTAWTTVNGLTVTTNPRDTGFYIVRGLQACKSYVVRVRAKLLHRDLFKPGRLQRVANGVAVGLLLEGHLNLGAAHKLNAPVDAANRKARQ